MGEFFAFHSYLEKHRITHRFSYPHTPQQNSRAQRRILHVVETGLALLVQASLPSRYWMQAFQTACYLINMLPTKVLQNQIPLQLLFNKTPNYRHLHVFGCLCFPSHPYMTNKLSYLSFPCVFQCYAPTHKGYICRDFHFGRIYISRHVLFQERSFPFHLVSHPYPSPLLTNSVPTLALIFAPSCSFHATTVPISSPIHTSLHNPHNHLLMFSHSPHNPLLIFPYAPLLNLYPQFFKAPSLHLLFWLILFLIFIPW